MTSDGANARVLLVEDSEVDAMILTRELEKGGLRSDVVRVETAEGLKKELAQKEFDVVISDYILPRFSGTEALSIVRSKSDAMPFILVSGKIGEEQAADAIRNGANDYIMKANLARLGVVVRRAMEEAVIKAERRKAGEELERSLIELKKRTDQLGESNKRMQTEMEERKKAQNELIKSREYLKSVIDSASELVFSVDKNLRISTWNKSLHSLTGFDEREVLNRSVDKIDPFSSAADLIRMLKLETPQSMKRVEFTLTTKDNAKKIVQAAGSIIRGNYNEDLGVLFIGRDITPNIEEHGLLIEGMGYLIRERGTRSSVDLFLSLTRAGKKGLFITRANPTLVSSWLPPSSNIQVVMLSRSEGHLSTPSEIITRVDDFVAGDDPSVILMDGGHYLMATMGFPLFLDTIFHLSEKLSNRRSIFLVRIDPNLFDEEKMAYLENELMILPSQKIEDVVIEDDVYSLLRYIQEQSDNNTLVSLKKIASKFQISHVTVAKRIDGLEQGGLVFVKKVGKQRSPFLTEKGKALLAKRRSS